LVALVVLACAGGRALSQPDPPVPKKYQRLFVRYVDGRSIAEKSLNLIGMTGQDVGRSFALIAGVSHYPRLPVGTRTLKPAEADRDQLISYLQNEEFFDEIVVLWDNDMNFENLSYFLGEYFPRREEKFPKSRFLLAYSGHGFHEKERDYLLGSSATSFSDTRSAIELSSLRKLTDSVVRSGYQVLVLLNSCYAGAFLTTTSFGGQYLPSHPGAHAITAGAAQEPTWNDSRIGPGSVFFEKVLEGLGGAADRLPDSADGIITTSELYAYLRQEVQISTDQKQAPQLGDLSVTAQSEGEFFFLNRSRQVKAKLVPEWNPVKELHSQELKQMGGSAPRTNDQTAADGWVTLAGDLPISGQSSEIQTSGSFGNQTLTTTGGKLRVEMSVSHEAVRYEQIEMRTPFVDQKLPGMFASGFGKAKIPIELEVSFFVVLSTSHPSSEFPIIPTSDGNFTIAPFTTSSCNFTCYYLEIIGTWTARGPDLIASGTIRSAVVDRRGIGADISADLDPTGYPHSIKLEKFAWHANSGGVDIPDLVNAKVGDVVLRLSASYISCPGVTNSALTLTSDNASK